MTQISTTLTDDPAAIHAKNTFNRNWWAFFLDYVFFGLALNVLNPNTTLPAFAARLTDSKVAIGLLGAIGFGGWLLPQLFAANYLSVQPFKRPYLLGAAWVGRPFFWLFALFLLLGGATYPLLTLILFMVGYLFFAATDGLAGVAYFDMLGKVMPAEQRSRMIGSAQAVRGILTIGLGWLVQRWLTVDGPAFPYNYVRVFGLAGLFLMAALAACYLMVEPTGEFKTTMTRWRDYLPQLKAILRSNRAFARITAVRLLAGLHMMASSFYVIHATQVAGQPEAAVGLFFTTQTIGAALAGVVLGWLATRFGTRRVVQSAVCCDLLTLVLALILALSDRPDQLAWLYPILFALLGAVDSAMMLGYFNYVLDVAPEAERGTYIGLTNTLAGILAIAPVVGGWLLERTSYPLLFGVSALLVSLAVLLAFSLPQSTHR